MYLLVNRVFIYFTNCFADLEKDVNTFGRGTNNDICFEPRAFKKNPQYQAISTKHFKLYRVGNHILLLITKYASTRVLWNISLRDPVLFLNSWITDVVFQGTQSLLSFSTLHYSCLLK